MSQATVQPQAPPDQLHDVCQTAKRLACAERTVRRLVADGDIGYVRVRGRLLFSDRHIRQFIDRNSTEAVA